MELELLCLYCVDKNWNDGELLERGKTFCSNYVQPFMGHVPVAERYRFQKWSVNRYFILGGYKNSE